MAPDRLHLEMGTTAGVGIGDARCRTETHLLFSLPAAKIGHGQAETESIASGQGIPFPLAATRFV